MSFVQPAYLLFLPTVLLVYWKAPGVRAQNGVLAVASGLFYGWIHPWFLALLYGTCLVDYAVAIAMERWPKNRNWLLALSLVSNLGLLGVFKYFDFFAGSFQAALAQIGVHTTLPTLHLLLPAGISFYTFQTLSYTIDVWRGRVAARRDLLAVVVFVSLFPQLVAGPVERARDLLPQVETPRTFDWEASERGLVTCLVGALGKIVVADTVGMYVDRVFALPRPAFPLIWAATLGFAVQILADFGGYTLLARGSAQMLGFSLVENFRSPYQATHPADFWRRWHISFSSWIHEYVYLPLRGPAPGPVRRTAATFGSMLVSGLWHGASWNFVLWGAYHAALLTLHRAWSRRGGALPRMAAVPLMFVATVVGWLLFREHDTTRLLAHLVRSPAAASTAEWQVAGGLVALSLAGGVLLWAGGVVQRRHTEGALPRPLVRGLTWGALTALLLLFVRDTSRDFLYFRF